MFIIFFMVFIFVLFFLIFNFCFLIKVIVLGLISLSNLLNLL